MKFHIIYKFKARHLILNNNKGYIINILEYSRNINIIIISLSKDSDFLA